MLQLTISLPIITLIFSDCISTVAFMYMQKDAKQSFARDFFFLCATVFCVFTMARTFTGTLLICVQDMSDKPAINIIHMPKRASDDTAHPTADTAHPTATSTTDPASEPSANYKAPSSPFAAKTPQTPSPANESMGPEEVEDEKK